MKLRKKGPHALFIIVLLHLTLKNTSTSLADDSYLGTLIYHMALTTRCRIYEKNCPVLKYLKTKLILMTSSHSCENLRPVLIVRTGLRTRWSFENCPTVVRTSGMFWSSPVWWLPGGWNSGLEYHTSVGQLLIFFHYYWIVSHLLITRVTITGLHIPSNEKKKTNLGPI